MKPPRSARRAAPLLKRAAIIILILVALAAIGVWSVSTPEPPRRCFYSTIFKSCLWTPTDRDAGAR